MMLAVAAVLSLSAAVVGTALLTRNGASIGDWVFNPVFQCHGILLGCALAMALPEVRRPTARFGGRMLLGGSAVIAMSAIAASISVKHNWPAEWTFLAELGAIAMIVGLVADRDRSSWVESFLSCRVSVWVGQRSYAIYLWHFPLLILIAEWFGGSYSAARLVAVPLTFLLAGISYRWIERPFLSLKDRRFSVGHRAIVTGPRQLDRLTWTPFRFRVVSKVR
jgi:peptidoglycan/LPS O-acetylase OafA/YrhL